MSLRRKTLWQRVCQQGIFSPGQENLMFHEEFRGLSQTGERRQCERPTITYARRAFWGNRLAAVSSHDQEMNAGIGASKEIRTPFFRPL